MVGINTSISRRSADGLAITAINFSIKSSVAKRWLSGKNIPVSYANKPSGKTDMPASGTDKEITDKQDDAKGRKKEKKDEKKKEKNIPKEQKESEPLTEKNPFNMDKLILDQMKDMEDLMDEMRQKFRK